MHGRLDVAFEDTGERQLKNIARPVRVYSCAAECDRSRARIGAVRQALNRRPAIQQHERRPAARILCRGRCGRNHHGPVRDALALRDPAHFQLHLQGSGRRREASRRLHGVRYVLEGEVRKEANRVRITAQLIDASSGAHLWSDRFEGAPQAEFRFAGPGDGRRRKRHCPEAGADRGQTCQAQTDPELGCLRLLPARNSVAFHGGTGEAKNQALQLFHKAIELDPGFSWAHGMAAWCALRGPAPPERFFGEPDDMSPASVQKLVGVADARERLRPAIAGAERHSQEEAPLHKPFLGVPPRCSVFTGREEELERLDAIFFAKDRAAAVTQTVGRAAVPGLGGVGKTTLAIDRRLPFQGSAARGRRGPGAPPKRAWFSRAASRPWWFS